MSLGTVGIWFMMLRLCRIRIPVHFLMASTISALLTVLCEQMLGSDFYANHAVLSTLIGIGISVAVGGCFNLLDARTIAMRFTRSLFSAS